MLNLPIVKFEKSCNYLNEQLTLQSNNKQLILDIISNIGLILNESDEKFEQYDTILETANEFLKSISTNITSIEQLNVEIKNITAELTSLLSDQNKTSKTKEFYIAAFSNIKHNIIVYSKKFQDLENTLTLDNNKFNEFINENNFKYNFVSIDNSTNTYTFTGFSINDTEEISNENPETTKVIEILEENKIIEESSIPDVSNEVKEIENDEIVEEVENENIEESSTPDFSGEVEESDKVEVVEEIINETIDEAPVVNITDEVEEIKPENIDKIEELTNEFKTLLLNISENNINDAASSVVSLFKEILPKENTTFGDFLDLGTTIETSEVESQEFELDTSDFIQLADNFVIADLEAAILETHSGLIYEFDTDVNEFVSYKEELPEEILIKETIFAESSVEDTVIDEPNISILNSLLENSDCLTADDILKEIEELDNTSEVSDILDIIEIDDILESSIEEASFPEDSFASYSEPQEVQEVFVEDLDDVNEDIENVNDIEILIDNIETIENVEKSIFEELNNSSNILSDLSFDSILENSDFNESNSIFDTLLDENIEDNLINDISLSFENNNTEIENIEDIEIETTLSIDSEKTLSNEELLVEDILDEILTEDPIENDESTISNIETIMPKDASINSEEFTLEDFDLLNDILDYNNINSYETDSVQNEEVIEEKLDIDINIDSDQTSHSEEKNIEHYYKDNDDNSSYKNRGLSKEEFDEKLSRIENALEDNKTLVISERLQKIYLPYKVSELKNYIESYPGSYKTLKDVVNQEFILPFNYFRKHPTKARFTEAYNLLKNREGRNFMKSVSYAFRLLNKNNLNPAIIASCKTQHELDSYLYYLDSDNLNNFKFFDIIYEVNPM